MEEIILLRYGEIALKGRNRHVFENLLARRIQENLRGLDLILQRRSRRWTLELRGQSSAQVIPHLQKVFGLVSFSPAVKVPLDLEAIQKGAIAALASFENPKTFKIQTRRANKTFPMGSMELSALVGGAVLEGQPHLRVDLHNPEALIKIEIREDEAFIFSQTIPGPGGLPVGSSGKVMLLLSGGIDSPVAGYRLMKRGATLEGVHFQSPPFTNERAKEKVIELTQKLAPYAGGRIRLHLVHFTEIQTAIYQHCPPDMGITIMRRFMLRLACLLAQREGGLALGTGESLGQVASQTLESMNTINAVTNMPILRPLIGMDKDEITQTAQAIDTYEISIRPHEDCCTIFLPKSPKTRPTLDQALRAEEGLDIDGLMERALEKTESIWVRA